MHSDLRFAFRQLAKSPAFSTVAIIALALGIGANTALFSIIDSIFLRPLPYTDPGRIVHLTSSLPDRNLNNVPFSLPRFQAVRAQQQVFSDLALGTFSGFAVTRANETEQVNGYMASANYLSVLGVQPQLGRYFSAAEDRPGGAPVALISDVYWQRHFNRDPSVLGRSLTLDGRPYTIIGVLPPALSRFPFDRVQIWTPRPEETAGLVPAQRDNGAFGFEVVARLKPGVSLAQAREEVAVIAAAYGQSHPANVDAGAKANVNWLLDDLIGNQRTTYGLLCGAVGCVLLIACANVANLLLARFTGRRKEIALRFALGATRGQVVRQLLVESVLVAAGGAILGWLFAVWGLGIFVRAGHDFIPRSAEISMSFATLGFTGLIAVLTGLAMGLLPAWHAAAQDVNGALKESARGSTASAAEGRLRATLLVAEIALSVVLLVGAALLLSSFARLQRVNLGFHPKKVFVGFITLAPGKYPTTPELAGYYHRLLERVATLPGVESVAVNDALPLSGNNAQAPVAVVGRSLPPLGERALAMRHLVSPGSFATLGMTLKAGRDFTERDNPSSVQTVIINDAFARRFFPGQDPIGQKLVTGMAQISAEIVGVVSDTRSQQLNQPPTPEYFLPVLQRPEPFTTLVVKTAVNPVAITGAVRRAMQEVDAGVALTNPEAMTALIARSIADRRLTLLLLATFAGLAVVLASIGVYSVMAYIVTQRTGEIAIRLALGATPAGMQGLVLRQGMSLVAGGIAVGLLVAFAGARLLGSLLFETRAYDPLIYGSIVGLIAAVAACACWFPARRATSVDPLVALRSE